MAFELVDLIEDGLIKIGEAQSDGSFTRTEGENSSITVRFNIWGAENASTAYVALMNYLRTDFSDGRGGIANYDLPLDTVQISSTSSPYAYTAEATFQFRQSYDTSSNSPYDTNSNINAGSYQLPEVEDSDCSFETSGGSAHITHGISVLGSARYDGSSPVDYGGLINPREDGTADGVDIIAPTLSFTIALSLPKTWLTMPYRLMLANLTGSVNAFPWGGYGPGSVLFKGINARATWLKWTNRLGMAMRDWYWRASYSFECAPAATDVIGGTTLVKPGFAVASQARESYADPTTGTTVSVAQQVDIIQVYPTADFSLLRIPIRAVPN